MGILRRVRPRLRPHVSRRLHGNSRTANGGVLETTPFATTVRSKWTGLVSVSASSRSRPPPGVPFDHGLYRIVREWVDVERRKREGPIRVDQPRVSRLKERMGPGTSILESKP